jgi:branched-chain amino acid aminotransferase
MFVWFNGNLASSEGAMVAATAAGLTLGWGVFSTIGVWQGLPFAVDRHLAR